MPPTTTPRLASNGPSSRTTLPSPPPAWPSALGTTQGAARRNRTRVAAGVLVMLACGLGVGIAFTNAAERTPVLVVDRPIRAGQAIEAGDLREALVGSTPDDATIAASRRSSVIGRTAAVDLAEGSLVAPSQLASGPAAAGRAVIGASMKDGQFPAELAVGDRVLAIVLPPESSADPSTTKAPVEAMVVGIEGTEAGAVAVSLAVDPADATALAVAGARQRLSLVLAP